MASATLIKRFAKRDRRIGSGVEEGILCFAFRAGGDQEQGDMPASTLVICPGAEHHGMSSEGPPSDETNR